MSFRNIYLHILIGGMIIIPLILLILPSDYFDHGQSICLSVLLFDQTCPGCGMTRAIQHIIHLDFKAAFEFNKLSFIVFPVLSIWWASEFFKIIKKVRENRKNINADIQVQE